MPFDTHKRSAKRIAIIGGGISGLGAAYRLAHHHHITLFEAEPRLGGHARTVMAGRHKDVPVDTGFLVYNEVNYPHLTRLFDTLDVPTTESCMSFGVSIDGGWLEYSGSSLGAMFAQKRNILRPKYAAMLMDILKFNKHAVDTAKDPNITIGDMIEQMQLGPWFRDYYLTPLTGAIWSTPVQDILKFPAQALITFMKNHALFHHNGH
ncbi:MAG: FAD-dependent oxidoreductase, partial [Pseudomonadota bacterium]